MRRILIIVLIGAGLCTYLLAEKEDLARSNPRQGWVSFDGSPEGTPPDVEILSCDLSQTKLRIVLHGMWVEDTLIMEDLFQLITAPEMTPTAEIGKPRLPVIREMIGLASQTDTVTISNISITDSLIFTDYWVFPLQRQPKSEYEPPWEWDLEFYLYYDDFYPSDTAETGAVGYWHILPICNLEIFPFRYNPVDMLLKVYTTLEVTLSHPGTLIQDTIPRSYTELYDMLINWDWIKELIPKDMENYKPHKLFIVADNLFNNPCVEKLIRYEKKKGFNTKKMRATEAGGSPVNPDSIKKTIKKFYESEECKNKSKYVVLIGDVDRVPSKVSKFGISEAGLAPDTDVLSDEWYELVKGNDYVPDLFLGRLPANDSATICHLIDKKIKYDTTAGDWVTKELLVAAKQNRKMDRGDGKAEEYAYKANKELCDSKIKDCGFTTTKVYGSDGGTNQQVKNAIENGVGEVNYRGHGSETSWSGWASDSSSWTKTDVSTLNNQCKEPIIWGIACDNNKIDHSADCIGEEWLKKCKAVAHFGSSRASPTQHNNWLDRFIHEAICEFKNKNETAELGKIIQKAKEKVASKFNPKKDEYAKLLILEYLLLGDPETRKWTEAPKRPEVNHQSSIPTGPQQFTTGVSYLGLPVPGVPVCLWKVQMEGDEVFDAKYTDSNGEATFEINPVTPGTLWVTVHGQNFIPYEGEVIVSELMEEFIRGDADNNMAVEMPDGVYILRYKFIPGSPPPSCMDAADADDNGAVEMPDAVYILRYKFIPGSPPPPAPFPDCGPDPTLDELNCGFHPCMLGSAKTTFPLRDFRERLD